MKIAIILGTRPEIIKMAPIIAACQKHNLDFFILHTGQHWSFEMDNQIFADLKLDKPKYNLGIGGEPYRKQVGFMTKKIGEVLQKEKPAVVLVQGDTASVLAGALAANKLGIKVGHIEAGLRSYDLSMLEEINRIIVDHISDYLFAPTEKAVKNLLEEGCEKEKIYLTGNTIVDAVRENAKTAERKINSLKKLGLKKNGYILATAHRARNVDDKERLQGIIDGLTLTGKEFSKLIIFPAHPRTMKKIAEFGIIMPEEIKIIEPLSFLEILLMQKNALMVLTDSGGLQEESFILGIPCVTLRDNTERPETVSCGANILAGTNAKNILAAVKKMFRKKVSYNKSGGPFGDGYAGEKIINIIKNNSETVRK